MLLALFGQSGIHITIGPVLVFSIFAMLLAVWLVFTLIIRYHWKNYGTGGVEIFTMNFIYIVGSVICIALMLISAAIYLTSST